MIGEAIDGLIRRCRAVKEEGDYVQDGLLYCGKCNTPKECRIDLGGTVRIAGCLCKCGNMRYEAHRESEKREEERERVDTLRLSGIADKGLRNCRFEDATGSVLIDRCRRYVDRWEKVRSENVGMILWGDTGGGKTYAAACIANALIDRGVPVMITSFPRILAAGFSEREELLQKICGFSLLVLDDLGAERETEAALETVYAVVDERYKSGKPLIVTTNLTLSEIREPKDMTHKRIYDRILEMCTPILVKQEDFRKDKALKKMAIAKDIFGG